MAVVIKDGKTSHIIWLKNGLGDVKPVGGGVNCALMQVGAADITKVRQMAKGFKKSSTAKSAANPKK